MSGSFTAPSFESTAAKSGRKSTCRVFPQPYKPYRPTSSAQICLTALGGLSGAPSPRTTERLLATGKWYVDWGLSARWVNFAKGRIQVNDNNKMSDDFRSSHCSIVDGHLANDELNCSDFLDMVDWGSLGLNLLDEDLTGPEGQMNDSSLTHANLSADVLETQNGYVSELDISTMEADGSPPNKSSDNDTITTFTSLVLFANNPSTQYIELKACDYSQQATIQALAAKLNLHCVPDTSSAIVCLRKYSHEETVSGLGQQISGILDNPATIPCQSLTRGNTGQLGQTREAHDSFATSAPSPGQGLGKSCSCNFLGNTAHLNHDKNGPFTKNSHLRKTDRVSFLSPTAIPSLPRPRCKLSSDHGSNLSVQTSVEPHSWQDSFPALSRTLKVIGACWRWGRQVRQSLTTPDSYNQTSRGAKIHIQDAFDRLESILDSADDTYMNVVLDILCSPVVELDTMRFSREHNLESNLLVIAWTLVDSPSVKAILQVEHTDQTLDVMKAAITYEMEYDHSSTVTLAIECLRNCVDMLRLHEPGYLIPTLHADCDIQQCRVESFRKLSSGISAFIEEFSRVVFRKENRATERKWWLSAFYGLYIQSFVRRTIVFVEDQSLAHLRDYHPELHRNCSNYLTLATNLFEAASASYDPLVSAWSLEKEPIDHKFDVRLIKYYRLAQKALKADLWAQKNIQSSFEFISLSFGEDLTSMRNRQNQQDILPTLPLRPMLRRSSIESTTRRFSSGFATESDVIYESESCPPVSSPAIESPLLQKLNGKGLGRLRTNSGAKRRASSPPQSDGSLRRNDSSSSMLNITAIRRRGLSFATQTSTLSSPYLVAYDSTASPRWNGSEDSLSNLPQLLSPDSPAPQGTQEFADSVPLRTPSLHNKSSNESFLEMPGRLNRKRSRGNLARSRNSQTLFMCECCPKKPKKFDSAEALSAHEREKQYECSYCGNRFKTKNEAERHQNSLHIRRQSWACSELHEAGYTHAFRSSLTAAGDNTICCYCGAEISEASARDDGNLLAGGIWDVRLRHLKDAHKFGECNTSKKFYRADHFRQHLRHSHAAVLGDGTSQLEAVCMKEVAPTTTANMI
ncbi:hypothetical protein FHL15_006892 [Xylaria flabelliformis]|uniref:C2H2-type domain-containing protein n=1 Tax=Xylaria flabelliformis TaxID=2512241 RepID=A0A553HWG5_9PEZI|nr:hypothetical protein FHL15_006892 [Xylaria flabelliformis]